MGLFLSYWSRIYKMRTLISLALLGLVALAAALPAEVAFEAEWAQFKATHGKQYSGTAEEFLRKSIYQSNKEAIIKHNEEFLQGKHTFTMAVNHFTDMPVEEFSRMMNRYQGQCGSCWAFSTTGSLEGQHARKSKTLVSLSEQQLVDCAGGQWGDYGCNGGLMDNGFRYIKAVGGLEKESDYPYQAQTLQCRFNKNKAVVTDKGHVDVRSQSESALQQAVATIGPISVAIDASHMSFQSYNGGVYYEPACSPTRLDHGVLAVGYGTENGMDYWLVKNSWTAQWGDHGYIKMSRNHNNNCGIATQASYPLV